MLKISDIKTFLQSVYAEFKKVSWPTKNETINSTIMVLIMIVFMAIFIGLVDLILTRIMGIILR